MSDLRAGPYRLEEASSDIKLAGPTIGFKDDEGVLMLAASIRGDKSRREKVEAVCDDVLAFLNGGTDDWTPFSPSTNDGLREALEEIMSSDVTNVAVAKEIAAAALGRE